MATAGLRPPCALPRPPAASALCVERSEVRPRGPHEGGLRGSAGRGQRERSGHVKAPRSHTPWRAKGPDGGLARPPRFCSAP